MKTATALYVVHIGDSTDRYRTDRIAGPFMSMRDASLWAYKNLSDKRWMAQKVVDPSVLLAD